MEEEDLSGKKLRTKSVRVYCTLQIIGGSSPSLTSRNKWGQVCEYVSTYVMKEDYIQVQT